MTPKHDVTYVYMAIKQWTIIGHHQPTQSFGMVVDGPIYLYLYTQTKMEYYLPRSDQHPGDFAKNASSSRVWLIDRALSRKLSPPG